jgi:hypothetical protein
VLDLKGIYGNNKFLYYLKSFGFTVSTNDESDKHYRSSADDTEKAKPAPAEKVRTIPQEEKKKVPSQKEEKQQVSSPTEEKTAVSSQTKEKKDISSQTEMTISSAQEKKGIFTRIREKIENGLEWITSIPMRIHYKISEILTRILDFLADITENIRKLSQKRDEIERMVRKLKRFLEQDTTKKAWKDTMNYIRQLLRHVRPKKFQGMVHFGLDNPATTGQVLGAVGVLMPIYREHIVIAPDFEQQIFEGELSARGRVQAGYIVILAIKVLLNRNLMRTITKAKSIIGGSK